MRLDLQKVLKEPGAITQATFEEDVELWAGNKHWAHVSGKVSAYNAGRYVLVKGSLSASLTLECSRCLKLFEQHVETPFDAQCEISYFKALAEMRPVEVDEDISSIFDTNSADITELVRQALVTVMPMRPLCSEECKGLCPYCGTNLNFSTCNCKPPPDPR